MRATTVAAIWGINMGRPVNKKDKREFRHESATATVFVATDRTAAIARVLAQKPKQGHGTLLMHQICGWADKNDILLWLEVQRFHYSSRGGMSNDDLIAFYEKFGFQVVDDGQRPTLMERRFQPSRK